MEKQERALIRRLNLGSGEFPKKGYINVDINIRARPDVITDLNRYPWPFKDDKFDVVEADHLLEHLDSPFAAMKEIHRISRDGARVIIRVPHFSRGFTHPDHKRGFDVTFPYYFRSDFKGGFQMVEFGLSKIRLRWFAQPYLKKTVLSKPVFWVAYIIGKIIDFLANLSPYVCSRTWCFLVGGFEEIEFHLIVRKSGGKTYHVSRGFW